MKKIAFILVAVLSFNHTMAQVNFAQLDLVVIGLDSLTYRIEEMETKDRKVLSSGSIEGSHLLLQLDSLDKFNSTVPCILSLLTEDKQINVIVPLPLEKSAKISVHLDLTHFYDGEKITDKTKIIYSGTRHASDFSILWKTLLEITNDNLELMKGGLKIDSSDFIVQENSIRSRSASSLRNYHFHYPESDFTYMFLLADIVNIKRAIIGKDPAFLLADSLCFAFSKPNRSYLVNKLCEEVSLKKTNIVTNDSFEFIAYDSLSQAYSSKKFKGKYILYDFWATWCGPCIKEMEHIKEIYEKYSNNKKFSIISISIDEKTTNWKNFIARNKYAWKQLIQRDNSITKKYEIISIPFNFIVDPDGKIIGRNLHQEDLDEFLKKILAQ